MRNPLADKVVEIKPSGIRKFFDIVNEMQDAISGMRVFIPWKRDVLSILPILV